MSRSEPLPAMIVAWLGLLAAGAGVARPAAAAGACLEAFSEPSSRKLFDALAQATPGDGCTLENVATDRSQMKVEWKRDGRSMEAILVVPTSCADAPATSAEISVIVPAATRAACPTAAAATTALVQGGTLGDLISISTGTNPANTGRPAQRKRRPFLVFGLASGGVAAAAATAGAIHLIRRRRRRASPQPRAS